MSAPVGERRSSVVHVDNCFVQLRRDYYELFDGDECAAKLAWLFEFATDNEMARRRLADEPGDPWLTLSVSRIQEELLETYKERAIQARLAFFKFNRLIQVDPRGGHDQINRYLFNGERMSHLLAKRKRLPFNIEYNRSTRSAADEPLDALLDAPGAPSPEPLAAPLDAPSASGGAGHYKEVDIRVKSNNPPCPPLSGESQTPTLPADANLDLEDDAIAFVQNAYSRTNPTARLTNLRARTSEKLCEEIRTAEYDWGPTDFRGALLCYLSERNDWLRENRWPIQAFLRQVKKYIPVPITKPSGRRVALSPADLPEPSPLDGIVIETTDNVNARPEPTPSPPAPILPFAAQEWNRVVTNGPPVESWTKRDRVLSEAAADPDFIEALPKVLPICQRAYEVQADEVGFLSFRWLLRQGKTGVDNWYAIASGDMNWLRARRGVKPKKPTIVEETMRKINARRAEIEQERLAAAERSRIENPGTLAAPVRNGAGVP